MKKKKATKKKVSKKLCKHGNVVGSCLRCKKKK
jgi:hypothetical protein